MFWILMFSIPMIGSSVLKHQLCRFGRFCHLAVELKIVCNVPSMHFYIFVRSQLQCPMLLNNRGKCTLQQDLCRWSVDELCHFISIAIAIEFNRSKFYLLYDPWTMPTCVEYAWLHLLSAEKSNQVYLSCKHGTFSAFRSLFFFSIKINQKLWILALKIGIPSVWQ